MNCLPQTKGGRFQTKIESRRYIPGEKLLAATVSFVEVRPNPRDTRYTIHDTRYKRAHSYLRSVGPVTFPEVTTVLPSVLTISQQYHEKEKKK